MVSFSIAPFEPAWWLPGAHLQTLGARALRSRIKVPWQRERLDLPDGDFVDLDFAYEIPRAEEARPLVLVLHGLEGSARSGYARTLYRLLRRVDIDSVGLNFRTCSGEMNRLPRAYHSGETDDLRYVLARLAERYPDRPLGAVGISVGGNVLLKYLGETGSDTPLTTAVAISVPFELAAGSEYLSRPAAKLYLFHLLGSLRRKLAAKRDAMPQGLDVAAGLRARTFREFDDAITAPLHGFADALDYYERCSSARYLEGIARPTLILHSIDDPFLPSRFVPREIIRRHPYLIDGIVARGGHIGFTTGRPGNVEFWAETQATRFLEASLEKRP